MEFQSFPTLRDIPNLRHAITTRDGGISRAPYDSLNLGFHVGDEVDAVRENRRRVAHALNYDASTLVCAQQVHRARCGIATIEDRGRGALDWESAIAKTDALIVPQSRVPVMILVADCAPVLIVDATNKVLCVAHAGWRGAVANIASRAMRIMAREFGSKPSDLRVGIGPCLCVECLEVGEEVAAQVQSPLVARRKDWPKPHLDLRAMIMDDLTRHKVLSSHIEVLSDCPRCENSKYFSHRGQNGVAGRFGLVAWWE